MNKLIIVVWYLTYCTISYAKFDEDIYLWSRSIAETFHLINSKAYYPIELDTALPKALDALVNLKDKNSRFLGPRDFNDLIKATHGEFFGIGVVIAPQKSDDGFLVVLDILPGGPAQQKGMLKYDQIIAINGNPVGYMTLNDAISKLKDQKRYSNVTLDILRNKNTLKIVVQRDLIKEDRIKCYYFNNFNIGYCALTLFTQQIAQELEIALKTMLAKKPKALILDLRDNDGGLVNAAIDCAGLFLEEGTLVSVTKNKDKKIIDNFKTKRKPLTELNIPIIILVNNYTASAAEILSGALKIHAERNNKKWFLLGTKTHGKGSVQEVIPVSNNCAVKITTCLYYLPNDTCIDKVGIEPDFVIEQKYPPSAEIKLMNNLYGTEITKHEPLKETKKVEAAQDAATIKKEQIQNDHQLHSAIDILSLYDIAQKVISFQLNSLEKTREWLKKHFVVETNMRYEEVK